MLGFIKKLFGSEPAETPVPYKVEAPNTVAKQAAQAVVENIVPTKKPAKPKAEKKPVAKAPRRPRAPKA